MYRKSSVGKTEDWQREPYERLAMAIVERAVLDYRMALKRLKRKPDDIQAERTRRECECFFRSVFFSTLIDLDGRTIETRIREESGIRKAKNG